ncbi:TRAP transporter small permease subunit [Pseudosulfitobacter koreensis]|uniref:TRAP transporter small permease protein n=1 Tax=Pseudosulfitobacter koreensis TaxID=2968472 RepID=A0ABT1Z495_9RHOB|nr:TRAP transporter small permease subunit [Pseudosulfitobacter koreense]MCR8827940.1 TRAP transporter small permease subunit [Pseudosulfitobacter koreense]
MDRFLTHVIDLCVLPGRLVGWLLLPLIAFVCAAVWAAQSGRNSFFTWDADLFLLGQGVTVNTLIDLQWHIFAILVLAGGSYAFRDDAHVSVDFVSANLSPRSRAVIQVMGDLLFVLPFCLIILWFGQKFAMTAFTSGEGSNYGGLQDRWFIKACVPIGFGLLGLAALARALQTILRLVRGTLPESEHLT